MKAQDPQFTQFYAAPVYLNPAFTGLTDNHRIAVNYRNQWPSVSKSFQTYLASYDYNLQKINSGIDELIRNRSFENVESVSEESVEMVIVEKIVDERLRKIYRAIVKKTHPDKISDIRLNDIYIMANKMYESNDIMGIYSICDQLGIPYDLSIEDGEILKSQISMMKERVGFMESTFTWKWYHTEDEGEKSRILVEYIKSKII